jgi:hypothetical protein
MDADSSAREMERVAAFFIVFLVVVMVRGAFDRDPTQCATLQGGGKN